MYLLPTTPNEPSTRITSFSSVLCFQSPAQSTTERPWPYPSPCRLHLFPVIETSSQSTNPTLNNHTQLLPRPSPAGTTQLPIVLSIPVTPPYPLPTTSHLPLVIPSDANHRVSTTRRHMCRSRCSRPVESSFGRIFDSSADTQLFSV